MTIILQLDVGINVLEFEPSTSTTQSGKAPQKVRKIVGDVEFESVREVATAISPVPGGVGPITPVMLMKNLLTAFKQQNA